MSDNNSIRACPVCDSDRVDAEVAEFDGVCDECGFVIEDTSKSIDPPTEVLPTNPEGSECKDWSSFYRVTNATEKRVALAFENLEELSNKFNTSVEIRKRTADLYCDGMRVGITDGRDTKCFVAACFRLASIEVSEPIPIDRMTNMPDVDTQKFRNSRIEIQSKLDIDIQIPEPIDYIEFIQDELSVEDDTVNDVINILDTASDSISSTARFRDVE